MAQGARRRGRAHRRPRVRPHAGHASPSRGTLLADLPGQHNVWMSHGDSVTAAPEGFTVLASTAGTPVAAFEDVDRGLAGVQWHPEVLHTEHGQQVLEHFLHDIAGCRPTWTMVNIVEEQVERDPRADRRRAARSARLSGGVDSAVAAAIVQRAIGDRLTCVYVDHGMMRAGRDRAGRARLRGGLRHPRRGRRQRPVPRRAGRGSSTPRRSARSSAASSSASSRPPRCASSATPPAARRHGVPRPGHALPRRRRVRRRRRHLQHQVPPQRRRPARRPRSSRWSSRCARCSRTRSAWSASSSACPPTMVWRQPFPGPGLGIRIIGEVTRERLDILRQADAIAREELTARRPRPRHLAVPGRAARRRPLGRRPGRRPHLRPPRRAPPGHLRGRDDRRLGPAALRRARADLHPHHQRGRARSTGSPSTSPASRPGTIEWE